MTYENNILKKNIVSLENQIEDYEQYSRSNNVAVLRIPQEPMEDVINVVKEVGKALDMTISDSVIDVYHRLKKRPGLGTASTRNSSKVCTAYR